MFLVIFRFVLDVLLATSREKYALSNGSVARFGFWIGVVGTVLCLLPYLWLALAILLDVVR